MTARRRLAVRVRRRPPAAQPVLRATPSETITTDGLVGEIGQPVILATMTPGLESTCAAEFIARVSGATIRASARGKAWFAVPRLDETIASVRTADNLFLHLGEVEVGSTRRDLADLADAVGSLPALAPILGGRPEVRGSGFVVNASRRGKQTWSRFEAGLLIAENIAGRFPAWPDLTKIVSGGHGAGGRGVRVAVELRVDLTENHGAVAWRLTPPWFRFRGHDRGFARASLLPTVAHALVLISDPRPSDRFFDPFAGSATIVTERASLPAAMVSGLEIDRHVAVVAHSNLPKDAHLVVGDASSLPIDACSFDVIVTNLPFGRQILDEAALPALYASAAREFARVLARGPQSRVVALTTRVQEVVGAMASAGFVATQVTTLSLNGQRPSVLRFVKE
jgi:23S rRNA G2445 N2-methylase RlmL